MEPLENVAEAEPEEQFSEEELAMVPEGYNKIPYLKLGKMIVKEPGIQMNEEEVCFYAGPAKGFQEVEGRRIYRRRSGSQFPNNERCFSTYRIFCKKSDKKERKGLQRWNTVPYKPKSNASSHKIWFFHSFDKAGTGFIFRWFPTILCPERKSLFLHA